MKLTLLTLIPLVGGVLTLRWGRKAALAASLAALAFVGVLWAMFDSSATGLQFVERASWVPSLGMEYSLGADGLGLLMLALSALLTPFAMAASWKIKDNLYFALTLFVEAGLFGTFTAQNFAHWFIFWELSLIPAFFLIKLWGGPKASRAAFQFFLYTMVGSVTMLAAFIALYASTGVFDFAQLSKSGHPTMLIFLGVFLGFAVKVPLVPFHTWLPDAYAEAPTGTSMLLTGAMSKMGVYGFLRILVPIFPEQLKAAQTPLLWLAAATIVLPAAAAFAQRDLKRIVAYSSINHLGYCMLGIFAATPAAYNGVVLQMFNHGITAAALFYFVGLIEERGGSRDLYHYGGLRQVAPVFCGLMGITVFASVGLPGLNGFVGEFLIYQSALPQAGWPALVSVLGLLLTAIFYLTLLQRVFTGLLPAQWRHWPDLTARERWIAAPAIALMFALGVYPQPLLRLLNLS